MGARNRVGIGLSYRPTRLHSLAEMVPWNRFLGSLNVLLSQVLVTFLSTRRLRVLSVVHSTLLMVGLITLVLHRCMKYYVLRPGLAPSLWYHSNGDREKSSGLPTCSLFEQEPKAERKPDSRPYWAFLLSISVKLAHTFSQIVSACFVHQNQIDFSAKRHL